MKRMKTQEIKIGNKIIGGENPILIQSMSTFLPSDKENCLLQIRELEKNDCDIVRVAILSEKDAYAIKEIKKEINIPIVADIHFDYNLGILSVLSGADKIRFNPGNIGVDANVNKLLDVCKEYNIPVRIGVNSGSIDKKFIHENKSTVDKAIDSLKYYVSLCENYGFTNLVLSVKMSNVSDTIEAYEKISKVYDYPLHLGLTEAGIGTDAVIKSSIALSSLLREGIGDTIRVSLTGDPVQEVLAAKTILKSIGLLNGPDLISCPTCGRCQVDLEKYANEIKKLINLTNKPITVAVMGCVVNGPGEAREADLGIAFSQNKGIVFKKGITIFTGNEQDAIEELKKGIIAY